MSSLSLSEAIEKLDIVPLEMTDIPMLGEIRQNTSHRTGYMDS